MNNDIYIHKNATGRVKITGVTIYNNELILDLELLDIKTHLKHLKMGVTEFLQTFKLHNPKKDVNQDIIKLIESDCQFKSFSGTTLDGRTVHLSLES